MRVSLQPLRRSGVFAHYQVQASLSGLAGYLIAGFSLVWVANVYMSLFARIRLEVKRERVQIKQQGKDVESGKVISSRDRAEQFELRFNN
jgi:hypothetical protein